MYGLADSLSDEYILPVTERERFEKKAAVLKAEAKLGNRSASDREYFEGAY